VAKPKGLRAVSNHYNTIAHITVHLKALIATKTGDKDEILFLKFFFPNI
jgi:hypothetical protein